MRECRNPDRESQLDALIVCGFAAHILGTLAGQPEMALRDVASAAVKGRLTADFEVDSGSSRVIVPAIFPPDSTSIRPYLTVPVTCPVLRICKTPVTVSSPSKCPWISESVTVAAVSYTHLTLPTTPYV